MPGVEVPQAQRRSIAPARPGREPEPAAGFVGAGVQSENQLEGPGQRRPPRLAYPAVSRSANASSRTSTIRGGWGPAGAAAGGLGRLQHPAGPPRSLAHTAAASAPDALTRGAGVSGSRRLGRAEHHRAASLIRRWSKAICPRSATSAVRSASGGPASTATSSQVLPLAPGVTFCTGPPRAGAAPADQVRGVSVAARSRERKPPRPAPARQRPAGRAFQLGGDPAHQARPAAWPRCQGRRSGSASGR